jgi:hypothetical protein
MAATDVVQQPRDYAGQERTQGSQKEPRILFPASRALHVLLFQFLFLCCLRLFAAIPTVFLVLISPESDGVAFFIYPVKPASWGLNQEPKPFRLAFEWVDSEGSVLHIHLGARQNIAAYNRSHIDEAVTKAVDCVYDSTDRGPFICSSERWNGHRDH